MVKKRCIENRAFAESSIGEEASLARTLTPRDIELFAAMSGDVDPPHVDEAFARSDMLHKIIAHGMWGGALISTVLGTERPGPGTIYVSQTRKVRRLIGLGDTVTVAVRATAKDEAKDRVTFDCSVFNQNGQVGISGPAEVIAPTENICRGRLPLPQIELREPDRSGSAAQQQ
jgi:phosphate acetyltransferase/phosphate butyryltransferase